VLAALKQSADSEEIGPVTRWDKRVSSVMQAAHDARKIHNPRPALDRMVDGMRHQGVVARLHAAPVRKEQDLETFF
jgi:hypothetical protein